MSRPARLGPAQPENVQVAAEVAALIGAEQVTHLRTTPGAATGQCWICDQLVDGAREPVAILAHQPEAAPTLTLVNLAHPTCAPSEIRPLSDAEVIARRADLGLDINEAEGTSVSAVTTVWPVPASDNASADPAGARPVVLMSFAGGVATLTEHGDRVDLVAHELLRQGWHLVAGMDSDPPPLPAGWRVRYTLDPTRTDVPGTLDLIDPAGESMAADIPLWPAPQWLNTSLAAGRRTSIYVGPLHLEHTWAHGPDVAVVEQALLAGALVGGLVEVEVRQG